MVVFLKSYTYRPILKQDLCYNTWSLESAESRRIFSSTNVGSIWMVPGTFSLEN
jgi:hypothetical protein